MRLQQSRHRVVGGVAPVNDPKRSAPLLKAYLKAKGCDLPFYDYLDSYEEEFQRIVALAKAECPSLVHVRVTNRDDGGCDWSAAESDGLTEIVFDGDEPDEALGFVCGRTGCFADDRGVLRTFVRIAIPANLSVQPNEAKHLFSIAPLLHEIGHVRDIERGIHFNIAAKTMSPVDADVSAHLFALETLADRGLRQPHDIHLHALNHAAAKDGKLAEVARRVLHRLPKRRLINWSDFL